MDLPLLRAMVGIGIESSIRQIGNVIGLGQIPDVPGRGKPATRDLPWRQIIEQLRAAGYDSDVGLDYVPSNRSAPSFDYVPVLAELVDR